MKRKKLTLEEIKNLIIPTLQQNGIAHASIFGSFACGEQKATSDVDILVEFNENKTLLDLIGLELALGDILGRPADLSTFDSLHPKVKENALKEQVILF